VSAAPEGWYPDPADKSRSMRYWDGDSWTSDVKPRTEEKIPTTDFVNKTVSEGRPELGESVDLMAQALAKLGMENTTKATPPTQHDSGSPSKKMPPKARATAGDMNTTDAQDTTSRTVSPEASWADETIARRQIQTNSSSRNMGQPPKNLLDKQKTKKLPRFPVNIRVVALLLLLLALLGVCIIPPLLPKDKGQEVATTYVEGLYVGDAGQAYLQLCSRVRDKTSEVSFLKRAKSLHKANSEVRFLARKDRIYSFEISTGKTKKTVTVNIIQEGSTFKVC
jgi:Protein of unknown function (DUF2510)